MAEKPVRVLMRINMGQSSRGASQEARDAMGSSLMTQFKKWKGDGVRLLGSWLGPGGELDGYCHYLIFEMRDLQQLSEINREFNRSDTCKIMERYSIAVGDFNQPWEEWWEQA